MTSSRDLDTVLHELLELTAQLDQTEAASDRAAIRDRLHELRAEAAVLRGPAVESLSDTELQARAVKCRRLLGELREARLDVSAIGGATGHGGGLDPYQAAVHNHAIDEAGGRRQLEHELRVVLAELKRRGGEEDPIVRRRATSSGGA